MKFKANIAVFYDPKYASFIIPVDAVDAPLEVAQGDRVVTPANNIYKIDWIKDTVLLVSKVDL